jgi:hypothetical protein
MGRTDRLRLGLTDPHVHLLRSRRGSSSVPRLAFLFSVISLVHGDERKCHTMSDLGFRRVG